MQNAHLCGATIVSFVQHFIRKTKIYNSEQNRFKGLLDNPTCELIGNTMKPNPKRTGISSNTNINEWLVRGEGGPDTVVQVYNQQI